MCGFSHITHYLHMTKELRGQNCQLLISCIKPHNPVSNSTIGKWVKSILDDAGIDVTKFSGNSARPAATSYGTHTGQCGPVGSVGSVAQWFGPSVAQWFGRLP